MSFTHTHHTSYTDAVVMTQSVCESAANVSGGAGDDGGSRQSGGPSITIKVQSSDKSIVYSLSKVSVLFVIGYTGL